MTTSALLAAAASFAASAGLTFAVRWIALRRQLLDHPNERSAHVRPTPRLGGIGIVVSFIVGAVVLAGDAGRSWYALIGATAFISVVGLVDDLRPLRARTRLVLQLCAAALIVVPSARDIALAWTALPLPVWLAVPASIVWIVWVTNLYNFMDGIDGLAGGQAVIGALGIALAAAALGNGSAAGALVVLAASAAGFLVFNFPPASIFMGDVGSTAIGFFLAALPFASVPSVPVECVGIALALFILDATTTLLRRMVRGERWFEAHRTHWYQRLLAYGVPHRRITVLAYAGMLVTATFAARYPSAANESRTALIASSLAVFAVYVVVVITSERRLRSGAQSHLKPGNAP